MFLFSLAPSGDVWVENYQVALKKASKKNKPILMVFTGSDWCKNCIALERELLEQEPFLKYADDNLILLRVDFPRMKRNKLADDKVAANGELAEKYNQEGIFPYMVIIDNNEKVICSSGYRKGGLSSYLEFFKHSIPNSQE